MNSEKVYTVIGLMSGTSLDGIDAALIRTDGREFSEPLEFISVPYEPEMRDALRGCLGLSDDIDGRVRITENEMTVAHAAAVDWLLGKAGKDPVDIDLIGFHGQTIFHDPDHKFTWQIGNGPMLARLTGIDVVNDFRSADVEAGGQGAPFLPLYHQAKAAELDKPLAILNLGGVGNVTYLGAQGEILAFDTGPANALIDDWVKQSIGRDYDEGGLLAQNGQVHDDVVKGWMGNDYFDVKPPKSLDRDHWKVDEIKGMSAQDGAATLTQFTVQSVVRAFESLPQKPQACYVTGGGRKNTVMMAWLNDQLGLSGGVHSVDTLGWDGDALEAEGFAYLAVRSRLGLPLSVPTTTGVPQEVTGGRFFSAVQD